MNAEEAAILCRFAKAACPQQAIDEHTPAMWALLLAEVRLEDAKVALVNVTRSKPFVAPAEIIGEVKRIRAKRIADAGDLTPPPNLTPLETTAWLREARRRVGDGETVDDVAAYGELRARHLPDLRAITQKPEEAA